MQLKNKRRLSVLLNLARGKFYHLLVIGFPLPFSLTPCQIHSFLPAGSSSETLENLLNRVVQSIGSLVGAKAVSIYLVDPPSQTIVVCASNEDGLTGFPVSFGEGIAGKNKKRLSFLYLSFLSDFYPSISFSQIISYYTTNTFLLYHQYHNNYPLMLWQGWLL